MRSLLRSRGLARLVAGLALSSHVTAAPVEARDNDLPVVDLGYVLQRASSYNDTGRVYNFSNIRYAAPPTGANRWKAPQPPAQDRTTINDGSVGRMCPQAGPAWSSVAEEFLVTRLLGVPFNTSFPLVPNFTNVTIPPPDPRESEDCLFLDVFVPKEIYDNRDKCGYHGAPVMVWFFGGGYVEGDKRASGSPSGIIERSQQPPETEGVIFVAMNYRLGAFGFMASDEIKSDGVANAGLLDQRAALRWVHNNIHLFGGNPKKVTIFGESAGGGSIMHQMTAYGGWKDRDLFKYAILQSPGWTPSISPGQQEASYKKFMSLAGANSLADLRNADTETLKKANFLQIYNSMYGTFTYGPVTDGSFVPRQPAAGFETGMFNMKVKAMAGHNLQEGLIFTYPGVTDEEVWKQYLRNSFPVASNKTLEYIRTKLYPPRYDGSMPYTDAIGRAELAISESAFVCNSYYLDYGYKNNNYQYEFAIAPSIHGQDVPYTFFTGNQYTPNAKPSPLNPNAITNVTVALVLQEYLTTFAQTGEPSAIGGIPKFMVTWGNATVEVLNQTSITRGVDTSANGRCRYWMTQPFLR